MGKANKLEPAVAESGVPGWVKAGDVQSLRIVLVGRDQSKPKRTLSSKELGELGEFLKGNPRGLGDTGVTLVCPLSAEERAACKSLLPDVRYKVIGDERFLLAAQHARIPGIPVQLVQLKNPPTHVKRTPVVATTKPTPRPALRGVPTPPTRRVEERPQPPKAVEPPPPPPKPPPAPPPPVVEKKKEEKSPELERAAPPASLETPALEGAVVKQRRGRPPKTSKPPPESEDENVDDYESLAKKKPPEGIGIPMDSVVTFHDLPADAHREWKTWNYWDDRVSRVVMNTLTPYQFLELWGKEKLEVQRQGREKEYLHWLKEAKRLCGMAA